MGARSLFLVLLALPAAAAPTGTNLSFEDGLTGWTHAGVSTGTGNAFHGARRLDLGSGFVEQTLTGFSGGGSHVLRLAYVSQAANNVFANARILVDGHPIADLHTAQTGEYLSAGHFPFTASGAEVILRIESLDPGPAGMLVDHIRILAGAPPAPPSVSWHDLEPVSDDRGGRRFENGSFEDPLTDPATDPDNSGPAGNDHLSGDSLPGWRVTRENVDVIQYGNANPPHGANALDINGHGPGSLAQTISALEPGGAYTISFSHARHIFWGSEDMTAEAWVNGKPAARLVRTIAQTWNDGYGLVELPVIADQAGRVTLEIRSTITNLGGCMTFDDFRIGEGANLFGKWATDRGITPDLDADDDGDGLDHGVEFVLGSDPTTPTSLPLPEVGLLTIPRSGLALSQGLVAGIEFSTDLGTWSAPGLADSAVTLIGETSGPGVDGAITYRIAPGTPRLFYRLTRPQP